MNRKHFAILIAPVIVLTTGCAAERIPPKVLVDARADYLQARNGMAMQLDPTSVHEADLALQKAEQAFQNEPDEQATIELAIIADRKALLAQSRAGTIHAQQDFQTATAALEAARAGQLSQTQQALGMTQMQLQQQATASAAQQARLQELEAKLKDARDTIAKIATVKEDDRGMVITLSGEVLFKTAKSDLKPAAMAKLDQIAQALAGKEQPIIVYGFTDNVGTRDNNIALSQNRAQTVRDYLVSKGMPKDLVEARGQGPDSPVADNDSVEGRAQNRRVEIVVQPRK